MIARLVVLVPFVLIFVFLPGYGVVRHLRWSPLEKLTGAIALSLVLLATLTFGVYLSGLPQSAYYGITILASALSLAGLLDIRRLLASHRVRSTLLAFGALTLWTLGAQSLIRHYSGGDWCCDWVEHYQRTLFFLERWSPDFQFIGRYPLTTRPPLMNLVCAYFLGHIGTDFALYQVVFSLLNLLAFFPCCLFARRFAPRAVPSNRLPWLVAIALAVNPMFFMNTTFAWTKVLTAFFVLSALWMYLSGWSKNDRVRLSAAFLMLSFGLLTHYSALPYVVFLWLAYAVSIWRHEPVKIQQLARMAVPAATPIIAWFAWSFSAYGLTTTLAANATVEGASQSDWQGNLVRIGKNIFHTFWPYLFPGHPDDSQLRLLTDRAFTFYQENFLGAIGLVNAYVVIGTLVATLWLRRSAMAPLERRFWLAFIPFTILVGIAIDGETTLSGMANICLQPVVYLAVTLVAAHYLAFSRPVRWLVWCGWLVDFVFGVALELYMESQMEPWARTPNWDWKAQQQLVYLGDIARSSAVAVGIGLAAMATAAFWYLGQMALTPERRPAPQ
jgi:hypothetical protein